MGDTEFISISWEGGIQFLIEAGRHTDMGDIQGLSESPESGLADCGVYRYFYENSLRKLDMGKCQYC